MIKKKKILLISLIVCSIAVLPLISGSDLYKKITRTFDIYAELVRTLHRNYIIELDPEVIFESAVEGILGSLDPYTTYFPADAEKDFEIFTEGTYTGFGISVVSIDSLIMISEVFKGFSAYDAGLRPGDRLLKIDTVNLVGCHVDSLTNYTSGKPGTTAFVRVIRGADTLDKTLLRTKVDNPDIAYYGIIDDNIGYIRLTKFRTGSPAEVREALREIYSRCDSPAGLIFDLRSNPGGVLTAAADICDMFFPEGELIVSTRGREGTLPTEYRSNKPAEHPDIRVAVLINGASASASEAMAGAFQDLDRGVVVGTRSFGKGLVQSFFHLPYDNRIKITTSKYYTPSGRCIQQRNFANKYRDLDEAGDLTEYKTRNGRQVPDAEGILPDTVIESKEYDEIVGDLYSNSVIFGYAIAIAPEVDFTENFKISDAVFRGFLKYIDTTGYVPDTYEHRLITELKDHIAEKKYDDAVIKEVKDLEVFFEETNFRDVEKNKADIKNLIEREIYSYYYAGDIYALRNIDKDIQAKSACKILKSDRYLQILEGRNE